jgi:predicted nuclease of predicted toxin-antitoxin system
MRFLIDQGVSPMLASLIREAGHEAVHVRDVAMSEAKDTDIVAFAEQDDRIIITEDMDFGGLLVPSGKTRPSVILFRNRNARALVRARLLLQSVPVIEADLIAGAIVVLEDGSFRVRRLGEPGETNE